MFKAGYVWLQLHISSFIIYALNVEMVALLTSVPSATPYLHQTSLCVGCEGVRFDCHVSTFQIQAELPETKRAFSLTSTVLVTHPTATTGDSAFRSDHGFFPSSAPLKNRIAENQTG